MTLTLDERTRLTLRRTRMALVEALECVKLYGRHLDRCQRRYGRDCSCGFDAARRAVVAYGKAAQEPEVQR